MNIFPLFLMSGDTADLFEFFRIRIRIYTYEEFVFMTEATAVQQWQNKKNDNKKN